MIVVSNATPIITLACVNQIDIFKHFFDKVYIPQAVYDEIKSKIAYGHKEMDADIVLIDETIGYSLAKSQQLNVQRTLSFLIASKKKGYIDEVKPLLDEMIEKGRWISGKVYRDVLGFCREL